MSAKGLPPVIIKAVLFDVGGVLTSSPFEAILDFEKSASLPAGFFRKVLVEGTSFRRLEDGSLSLRDFIREFEAECEGKVNAADWLRHLGKHMVVRPAFLNTAEQLKQRGLKVGIITNNWKGTLQWLPPKIFDVVVESYLVKMRKPDAGIYEEAFRQLQELDPSIKPENIVFLDDIPANVRGAQKLGWHSIHVPRKNPEVALDKLKNMLGQSAL